MLAVLSDLPNQISPELSLSRGLESLSVAKGTYSTCAERLGSPAVGRLKNPGRFWSLERSYEAIWARGNSERVQSKERAW